MASIAEPFASGNSFIHGIDPRIRLTCAVVTTVPFALLTSVTLAWTALASAVLFVIMAKLSIKKMGNRLLIVNVFIVFLWFFIPFSQPGDAAFSFGPLTATRQGIDLALLITIKSNAIVLTLMALLGTIPISNLGPAMQKIGIPNKLCHILLFTYRYIFVIYQEYILMRQAMRARGFAPKTDKHTYRSYAWLVGMLLVKSWDRAERVMEAMSCRGFHGRFYTLTKFSTRLGDVAFLGICLAFASVITLMELTFRGLI